LKSKLSRKLPKSEKCFCAPKVLFSRNFTIQYSLDMDYFFSVPLFS